MKWIFIRKKKLVRRKKNDIFNYIIKYNLNKLQKVE